MQKLEIAENKQLIGWSVKVCKMKHVIVCVPSVNFIIQKLCKIIFFFISKMFKNLEDVEKMFNFREPRLRGN